MTDTFTCARCLQLLPESERYIYRERGRADVPATWCKTCRETVAKETPRIGAQK